MADTVKKKKPANKAKHSKKTSKAQVPSSYWCRLCLEQHQSNKQSFTLTSCSHTFCKKLLQKYEVGLVYRKCICPCCTANLDERDIKKLLPRRVLAGYIRRNILQQNPTYRECPFCDELCKDGGPDNKKIKCSNCARTFCYDHGNAHRPQMLCSTYEARFEAVQRPSLETVKATTRGCPCCGVRIEKNGGCPYVRCRCGAVSAVSAIVY